ncbi:MAG: septation ring formation regulator EzrA [Bacilli bacterium]
MNGAIILGTIFFVVPTVLIIITLNIIQTRKNNKIKKIIDNLEYEKNVIDSAPITPELAKIEAFLKNEKLEIMYNGWKEKLNEIKSKQIPKITDMILETEYSLSQQDYKGTNFKLAKLEMEVYRVRTESEFLLNEIKEITTSDEKNRAIITTLKSKYRDLYQNYTERINEFGDISKSVGLQFESIAHRFEDFECAMEKNEYTEVTQIIKAIDDMLKHMEFVVDEIPSIVLMTTDVLPKKIKEIEFEYKRMLKEGYQVDYLNVEYNISEANKKIEDVLARSKVLNLEDSTFELKVLTEYLESLFTDFEKERNSRDTYEDTRNTFSNKLNKVNDLVNDIFFQINDIKKIYNLSDNDIELLDIIRKELSDLNNDYKSLLVHTSNNAFAYSQLISEIDNLASKLSEIENRLDVSLDAIGNMKEDEARARQQLEEIKNILRDSRSQINDYNLPTIPKVYYTELSEAANAIKEIMHELEQKPITISILNTRVDTARDLVFKLLSRTKELIKHAKYAEIVLVYGNRYRSNYEELDKTMTYSEGLFYKGEYQKSFELTINYLSKIEPNILEKLNVCE